MKLQILLSNGQSFQLETKNEYVPDKRSTKNGHGRQARRQYNNSIARQTHHSSDLTRSIYTSSEEFAAKTIRFAAPNHDEIRTASPNLNLRTYDSNRAH